MRGIFVFDKLELNYMYVFLYEVLNNLDVYKLLFFMIFNFMIVLVVEIGYKSWYYFIFVNFIYINLEIILEILILFGKYW